MRILEIETVGRGGLAHYAHNLSAALAARGHEVTLVTAAGYELDGQAAPPPGFTVLQVIGRVGHRLGTSLPGLVLALWRKFEAVFDAFAVARLARRLRPDVVHLHCTNPIALLYVGLLRHRLRPLVLTAHVVTPHERMPLQRAIWGRIYRPVDLVVAHSEFDRRRLLEELAVAPGRVTVIPHGEYGFFARRGEPIERATARLDLGLEPGNEVALFFGYVREYKGLDLLLEAWPAVASARSAARLVVAGDPVRLDRGRREELREWATRLGVVHRFGYVPFSEVARYFAAADVLVMPYRRISQSGVLYLALSLGVAVVATRVGGLPELLADGESALLVEPDSPEELARALSRALGEASLRERLARGGRRIADEHSWPAIAGRTELALARLLEDRRTG